MGEVTAPKFEVRRIASFDIWPPIRRPKAGHHWLGKGREVNVTVEILISSFGSSHCLLRRC